MLRVLGCVRSWRGVLNALFFRSYVLGRFRISLGFLAVVVGFGA